MKKLSHCRAAIFALAACVSGCATVRHSAPVPEPEAPAETPVVEVPGDPAYSVIRQAFVARTADPDQVQILLDSLSVLLPERFVSPPDSGTVAARQLTGLVRATIEGYHAVLPRTMPIMPQTPLARFLDAVPSAIAANLSNHPHYIDLYIRKLAGQADVPVDYTPEVASYIRYFSNDGRDFFARWLSRSTAYMPMILSTFRDMGLPEDMAYKAMIESGFQPVAQSRVRATGMWQFMHGTALLYGLKNNAWLDERREPEKATRAAAQYLRKLYRDFGDWRLVVAAYNCGEGRLERAIRDSGSRNFWEIHTLPSETRHHVPKFMAAVIISKDPAYFGFGDVVYQPALVYDTVPVQEPVSLRIAARCAGTTYAWMQQLNPELHRGYTPPTSRQNPYLLRVPVGTAEKFIANYARVPDSEKIHLTEYVVKPGDTISGIARRLGVRAQAILDANGIGNPRLVRVGRKLTIPIHPERQLAQRSKKAPARTTPASPGKNTTYMVRNGDSLWGIARREGVTVAQLQVWNNLKPSQPIRPGEKLVVGKSQSQQPIRPGEKLAAGKSQSRASADSYYTVRNGDTLWGIARTFQASVEDLKTWNGIGRPSSLRPGTRIRVRPETAVE